MSVQQTLAIKFRDHIIDFLDELIEQFPEEAEIIISRIFIKDQIISFLLYFFICTRKFCYF